MTENSNAGTAIPAAPLLQKLFKFGVPVLLTVLAIAVNGPSLAAPGLLDEQFLIAWFRELPRLHASSGFSGLMQFPGFESWDCWGLSSKLFLLAACLIFGKSIFFLKLIAVLLHAASAIMVFLVAQRLNFARVSSFLSALFFVLYPLHYEACAWLGGIGSSLSTLFFLASFYVYLGARRKKLDWLHISIYGFLLLLSLGASLSVWPVCLLFALYEAVNLVPFGRQGLAPSAASESGDSHVDKNKLEPSMAMISVLLPILLGGICLAASGYFTTGIFSDFRIAKILNCLKFSIFPINEINWHKYSREYRAYFVAYPFLVLALASGIVISVELRRKLVFLMLSFLLLLLPCVGVVLNDSSLYGERLLYPASVPFVMILALAVSALLDLKGRLKILGVLTCVILGGFLSVTFLKHLWNENAANRNYARAFKAVQKSMKILQEKERMPFLLVRDLPEKISIAPLFSPRGPVLFDAGSGLMRSNPVPDGRLKELLRQEKIQSSCWRWSQDLNSFLPLDLGDRTSVWTEDPGIEAFSLRMQPGVEFYSNIHWGADKKELLLESNSENGPMITVDSHDLSTLDGDYLFVDAIIDAPTSFAHPKVELHWQTRVHENYEKRERFSYADACINDGKVHRYLLSIRANGWTTGGGSRVIAIGFPAGSRVRLKTVGLLRDSKTIPSLNIALANQFADLDKKRFQLPFYNYPTEAQLGLAALADGAATMEADYSVAGIEGAVGILTELSYPNKYFDDANSKHLSGQCYKTFRQNGVTGKLSIPTSQLPGPGVYSIRVIAASANNEFLGQFSDPLCFQVPSISKEN